MVQEEFDINKIKLIVGLGNTGRRYENTRHNAGFIFLDSLADAEFKDEPKFKALTSLSAISHRLSASDESTIDNRKSKILLAKPTTLMNNSGEAVALIKHFYKIKSYEILIAHDDLDIKIGNYKLQFDKGPKVHNGILSIEQHLKTSGFWRLRIGIDNRTADEKRFMSGQDYVLGHFREEEEQALAILFSHIF